MKDVNWKKITQFEGPEQSLGFLLWQVSTQWRRQIEAALSQLELTHPQFVLLASLGWLTRNNAAITQVELARHCRMDITTTSQVLRSLEKRGYVQRLKYDNNEKSKFPRITEAGALLVERAIPIVEAVDHEFFNKLHSDTHKCLEILQKLV